MNNETTDSQTKLPSPLQTIDEKVIKGVIVYLNYYVTLHENTKHNALAGHQSEIQAKVVSQCDNYQISLFGID